MAKRPFDDAVRDATAEFLKAHWGTGDLLRQRVADELTPWLANFVRQHLLHQLGEAQPDERLDRLHQAITNVATWWAEGLEQRQSWDDYPESLFRELTDAAANVPAERPAQLNHDTEAWQLVLTLTAAVTQALTVFEALQKNPLILEAELVYPIERMRKALEEVARVEP